MGLHARSERRDLFGGSKVVHGVVQDDDVRLEEPELLAWASEERRDDGCSAQRHIVHIDAARKSGQQRRELLRGPRPPRVRREEGQQ